MSKLERIEEERMVLDCQLRRPEAFRALVSCMEGRLLYYVRRFVSDESDALDVLQDVWVQVFRRIGDLRKPAAFRGWIYCIAHSVLVSRNRKLMSQARSEQLYAETQREEAAEPDWTAADAVHIHRALARLGPIHREVLTLRFLEDMTHEEIALATGTGIGTVKSRLHYAKSALRGLLEGVYHEQN